MHVDFDHEFFFLFSFISSVLRSTQVSADDITAIHQSLNRYTYNFAMSSSYTPADVRKMVDDLDEIIWAAIRNGTIEATFKKERITMVTGNLCLKERFVLKYI